jgi:DNA-binding FrmR family transcriptional regulator
MRQAHDAIIKRVKCANSRLRSIIATIEAGCEAVDMAQQLHAAEKAV